MDRVTYDRFWGIALLVTCIMPLSTAENSHLWHVIARTDAPLVSAWLIIGSLTGLVAMVLSLMAVRGRWRHFMAFLLGALTLALPMFDERIWQRFPYANPAMLPMSDLATVGWVMLVALGALYAGSGVRIVRPAAILGQAMGGLGAFLLLVFVFLPMEGQQMSFALSRIELFADMGTNWRVLVPFLAVATSVFCGMLNLVRSRLEVVLAKLARITLIGGLLFWIALPFVERSVALQHHLPVAWGTLRFLAPLFLAVDGTVAFMAISFTRSGE